MYTRALPSIRGQFVYVHIPFQVILCRPHILFSACFDAQLLFINHSSVTFDDTRRVKMLPERMPQKVVSTDFVMIGAKLSICPAVITS